MKLGNAAPNTQSYQSHAIFEGEQAGAKSKGIWTSGVMRAATGWRGTKCTLVMWRNEMLKTLEPSLPKEDR